MFTVGRKKRLALAWLGLWVYSMSRILFIVDPTWKRDTTILCYWRFFRVTDGYGPCNKICIHVNSVLDSFETSIKVF
jgi:hypothetical protein